MLKRSLLSSVLMAPESGTGSDAPVVPDPATAAAVIVVPDPAEVVAAADEGGEGAADEGEEEGENEPQPAQRAEPAKKPWYLERIAQESERARRAEERSQKAEREATEAQSLLSRMQHGSVGMDGRPVPPQAQQQPNHQPVIPPQPGPNADRQAEINQAASTQRLYEDSLEVRNRGLSKFGASFEEKLAILTAIGATSDDFIGDVLAVDKYEAHVLLDQIAKEPEKAVTLVRMNSKQRIAELTRMSMANKPAATTTTERPAPKPTTKVSKVPAPSPPLQQGATKVVDGYADNATDAQFTAKFNERMKARAANRR
jgi:hypothetical protein